MRTAIVARHAESEFSVRGTVNGDPTVAGGGLTAAGVEQARKLAAALAERAVDLCVTSEFVRARETADVALAGREVPRLVLPDLNDIRFGAFEGSSLDDYRRWAHAHGPADEGPGGGESRVEAATRFARAFRTVLERPEETVLVVAHGLPVRYVLNAVRGIDPAAKVDTVEYAEPHALTADALETAVARLERWVAAPAW